MPRKKTSPTANSVQSFLEAQEKQRREESERMQTLLMQALSTQKNTTETNEAPSTGNSEVNQLQKVNVTRPPLLDTEITYSKFLQWKSAWHDYAMLNKHDKLTPELQKADFRCCLTEGMRLHLKCAIGIDDNQDISVDEILDKIGIFLRSQRNIALDRVAFDSRQQLEEETFDQYLVEIKRLAEEADLCKNCIDQRLATKIMSGIRCSETRQKLLAMNPFPELQDVINICRSRECAARDSNTLSTTASVDRLQQKKSFTGISETKTNKCYRCDINSHQPDQCQSLKYPCKNCGKKGHWIKVCGQLNKTNPSIREDGDDASVNRAEIEHLNMRGVTDIKTSTTPRVEILCRP